jgi:hypothetical protein
MLSRTSIFIDVPFNGINDLLNESIERLMDNFNMEHTTGKPTGTRHR